ncbi:MAG: septum formation initiator family protein [Patescibacteria group bacterium]
MKFSWQETSRTTKMVLIGEFLLVSYLLYALALNVYQGYQIDYHIQNFQNENRKIAEANQKAADDLLYYTSNEYLEKMAKQNLGLVNPGEEVVVLSEDILKGPDPEGFEQEVQSSELQRYYNLSNPHKWWKFFFEIDHRKKDLGLRIEESA